SRRLRLTAMLNCSPAAWQAAMTPSSCSNQAARHIAHGNCKEVCMSEGGIAFDKDASPERNRYRGLLEITDLVVRAKSLPDAFKDSAPPVLALTGGELLNYSSHDPRRDCMLTHYWKRNQESGEFDPFPVDDAATGWVWKHQELIAIPESTREHRFGALGLGMNVPGAAKDDDVELLSRVALMGALVLEKDRAYSAFEEQQSLVAISRELSSSLELEKLLPVILSSLRNIARYERAVLGLLDEDGKSVHLFGDAKEWEPFVNSETKVPIEEALSGRAIRTRNVALFTADDLREMEAPMAKAMY